MGFLLRIKKILISIKEEVRIRLNPTDRNIKNAYVQFQIYSSERQYQKAKAIITKTLNENKLELPAYFKLFNLFQNIKIEEEEYNFWLQQYQRHTNGKFSLLFQAKYYRKFGRLSEWESVVQSFPKTIYYNEDVQNELRIMKVLHAYPINETLTKLAYINKRLVSIDAPSLIEKLIYWGTNQTPVSYLRVSDGEGTFIGAEQNSKIKDALYDTWNIAVARISNIMFGQQSITHKDITYIAKPLMVAYLNATVLHLPSSQRIKKSINKNWRGYLGMAAAINFLYDNKNRIQGKYCLTDINFKHIAHRENVKKLIKCNPNIGLISCYDSLLPKFKLLGAQEIKFIQIPAQTSSLKQNKQSKTEQLYPKIHQDVLAQIAEKDVPRIYFVAAGILSKQYCDALKQEGHIVLDLGSSIDMWIGVANRGEKSKIIKDDFLL